MKKIVTACFGIWLCAACHKNNANPTTGSGFWEIDDQRYNANYVTRKDTAGLVLLLAQDEVYSPSHPVNSIGILFNALPADSGSFQVLWQYYDTVQAPGPGQISVFGTRIKSDPCGPQAFFVGPYNTMEPWTLGPPATVKVINGKISVVIPPLLAGAFNTCDVDSLKVFASIQEH
jgi:hypothetical protein